MNHKRLDLNMICFDIDDETSYRYFMWDKQLKLAVMQSDHTTVEFFTDLNDPGSIQIIEDYLRQLKNK